MVVRARGVYLRKARQMKFEDLTGKKFNKLLVLETFRKNNRSFCKCLCDCGKQTIVEKYSLKSGGTKSCGCLSKYSMEKENLTNKIFNRWTVLKFYGKIGHKNYWLCRCECGTERLVNSTALKSGSSKSCGCLQREIVKNQKYTVTHGLSKTRLYRIYRHMIERCYSKTCKSYKNYGDRGITVCDEWLADFMNFYNWAINNGYNDNLTIDRIDNNKGYSPDNCRWVTVKEQANNRRTSHLIVYKSQIKTIAQWAEELQIKPSYLYTQINRKNLTLEEIIED